MSHPIQTSRTVVAFFALLAGLALSSHSQGQLQLTRDIFAGGNVNFSKPEQFTQLGSSVIFVATTGDEGKELWKTDGTTGGTALLKDISVGTGSSSPKLFGVFGSTLFFSATDGASGVELWKTDGTPGNTVMVKDIMPGSADSLVGSLNGGIIFNGMVFFTATDSGSNYELWKSDGTDLGTVRVKDIRAGAQGSAPQAFVVVGSTLFFTADDGSTGTELWTTNGTDAGTVLTKDINTGGGNSSNPLNMTAIGSMLYFVANTATTGYELWKSDGTGVGTVMVKDINPGSGSCAARYFTAFNGAVYFAAQSSSFNAELWKTDGTAVGTVLVKEINPSTAQFFGSDPAELIVMGSNLYFIANDGTHGRELWQSDGSAGGTVLLKDINPDAAYATPFTNGGTATFQMTILGGALFFYAKDDTHGSELWKSDGTSVGTVLLKDLWPGISDANIGNLRSIGTKLYFAGDDSTTGPEPFISDGSAVGTVLLKDIGTGTGNADPAGLADAAGTLFFKANDAVNGQEVWSSNGTNAGTTLTKNINPSVSPNDLGDLAAFNGSAYFSANDNVVGYELWRSDGTATGTVLVKDLYTGGLNSSRPEQFTPVGDLLYFVADAGPLGAEIFKTDGSSAGTVIVKDIAVGSFNGSSPTYLTAVGSTLFLVADNGNNGGELWKSNGTAAGTMLVKDLNGDSFDSGVSELTNANGTLFFTGDDDTHRSELWKSNGTAAGTVLVKDINTAVNGASSPSDITAVGSAVFFSAFDPVHGEELWKSNGTAAGTVLVKDIVPGVGSSTPYGSDVDGNYGPYDTKSSFAVLNGVVFFSAQTSAEGRELWKSDGTDAGTVMVMDIALGSAGSDPKRLTPAGNFIYFDASVGGVRQLWKTDGTSLGTTPVDASVSNITRITLSGTSLFVTGTQGAIGQELFVLPNVRPPPIAITTHPLAQEVSPGGTVTFTVAATGTGPLTYRWRKNGVVIPGAATSTLKLTKVTEASEAVYDALVLNGSDSIISNRVQLMVNDPVVITGQPVAVLAATGTIATFTAVRTGTAPISVQWYKGTVPGPAATLNPLVLNPVMLADAGLYKVKLTNVVNSVYTTPAQLAVVDTSTQIIGVNNNATMLLTAPAKGTGLTYQWFRNSLQLNIGDLSGRITKVTGSTLSMAHFTVGDEALFTCRVSLGAQQVMSGNLDVRLRNKPNIAATAMPPSWIVSGTVNSPISSLITFNNPQPQHAPTIYSITGLPAGLIYSKTTGQITGKPATAGTGTITLKITATNAAGSSTIATVLIPISALPGQAIGEFRGIATRSSMNSNLGASITLSVTASGVVTGKLMHGTSALPFTVGVLDATVGSNFVTTNLLVKRGTATPLQLAITSINGLTGEVAGTITDTTAAVTSTISAWRNPWRTATPANLASALEGAYTAAFQISTGQIPNPINDEAYPQGDGYALLKFTTAGVVTGTCRLADSTVISVSTLCGPQGQLAVYLPAYSNTGSALGWTQVTPNASNPPDSYANNLLDGTLSWFKAAQLPASTTRSYKGGVPLHNLTVIGSAWRKPISPAPIPGFADLGIDNAKLIFTKARINETSVAVSNQLLQTFRIKAPSNTASVPTNTAKLVVTTLNTATGEITGLWKTHDTNPQPPGQAIDRTANYYGAIVNRLTQGPGHFVLARLPTLGKLATNTDILSGKALLQPNP